MSKDEAGLLDALARFGGSVFGMLQNRLELASVELGEAGSRLVLTIVASFAALLLLAGAVAALSAWVALAACASMSSAPLMALWTSDSMLSVSAAVAFEFIGTSLVRGW